ncbi:MAG: IS4 family transposase, partial [Planctomycetes bacterium]|nr:IS4 family transposase [Planctomycetota bacterium]
RRNCSPVDLLIRAQHNRKTMGENKLFEEVKQSPIQSRIIIKIPRQSTRVKKQNQKARSGRAARNAEVTVRYIRTELKPPPYFQETSPISLGIIHVQEENPPADAQAVEWFLLTTIDIQSKDDALDYIEWYCLRWRIEDWHRVLKSGCGVEALAHKTAERLKRAIAINLVIAWRIMLMTLLGREMPELPPDVLCSDIEIEVLRAYAKKKHRPSVLFRVYG